MLEIVFPVDYGLATGGGLSPVDSTFSVVVLVVLSGVVSTLCSTVVVVSPPGVVTVVSVFFSVVAVGWQPMLATPTMQAAVKNKMFFIAESPEERMGVWRAKCPLPSDDPAGAINIPDQSTILKDPARLAGMSHRRHIAQSSQPVCILRRYVRDCRPNPLTVRTRSLGEAVDR